MCAIVDANAAHLVFGSNPSAAGRALRDQLDSGKGRLVSGGKHLEELQGSGDGFREWASQAVQSGVLEILNEQVATARTEELRDSANLESDDPHVIALAQLSRARLLFTNDQPLIHDFKKKAIVDEPRGKVVPEPESRRLSKSQRRLIARKDLCRG